MHGAKKSAIVVAMLMILTVFISSQNASASQGTLPNESWSDNGWDSDGNGLYDKLNVTIHVNVTIAGQFRIRAYLHNSSGDQQIDSNIFDVTLGVGNNSVLIQYRGAEIRAKGFDGPYRVTTNLDNDALVLQDTKQFLTAPYNYTQFDRHPLEYTGIHTDYAFNVDIDSRLDYLRVNVTYTVWKNGTYRIMAYLYDSTDIISIDNAYLGDFYRTTGTSTFSLDFEGMKIQDSGFDGQYRVRVQWFTLEGMYWYNEPHFLTIGSYDHTLFQPPGFTVNSMTEQVIDTDADSFYDELLLTFNVSVIVPGAYAIRVDVQHGGTAVGNTDHDIGDLYNQPGYHILICSLDIGYRVESDEKNATFSIITYAKQYKNGAWTDLGVRTLTTAATYDHADFARKTSQPKIIGTPLYQFVDFDSDGKYDWIDATINVSCGVADSFILHAYLREYGSWSTATSVRGGAQTVDGITQAHLKLPAWPVNTSMINSPYRIDVILYMPDSMIEISRSSNGTISGSYNSTDFNGTLPIEFSLIDEYGIDYDGDGKYDVLAVEGKIKAHISDIGQIYAYLKNDTSSVGYYDWYGNFFEGEETPVILYYSGTQIRGTGIESPYHLEMTFYDDIGNYFDFTDVELIDAYTADMFEDPEQTLVSGQIVDDDTGAPIDGASVSGTSYVWGTNSSTTNATGGFSMTLSSGLVSLTITKSGYVGRTLYFEASGASATKTLELSQIMLEDSTIKGYVEFKDGSNPPAAENVRLLYIGDHQLKTFMMGPNGYYEVLSRSGPVILEFGIDQKEFGSARIVVPASSTIWNNYTMQHDSDSSENWDYLFIDWNHGWVEHEYNMGSYECQEDAVRADLECGDSNGIVTAEEARIYALTQYGWATSGYFDTSEALLVENKYYSYNRSKLVYSVEDLIGPIENIGPITYVLAAPFESPSDMGTSNFRNIKLGVWYDGDYEDYGYYGYNYRIQLPAGSALDSQLAPDDVSISGTSLISTDPGLANDKAAWGTVITISTANSTEDPQTGSIMGKAIRSDKSSHEGILVDVLDKNGNVVSFTFTNPTGDYSIIGLPYESHIVKASKSGYYPAGLAISAIKGLHTLGNIVLYSGSLANFVGGINGTVMNETDYIGGATVVIWYLENETIIGTLTTDDEGNFGLSELDPGAIVIKITATGYLPFEGLLFINGLETLTLNFVLTAPSGGISGRIVDDQGVAHEGVLLKLYDSTGNLVATTNTGADGNFTFEHVMDGTYNISIFWGDRNIGNITDVVVFNGTMTNVGSVEVPASAFAVSQDYLIFVIAAAAIVAVILGILWFMRRPPAKKKSRIEILKAEEGVAVDGEDEPPAQTGKRKTNKD